MYTAKELKLAFEVDLINIKNLINEYNAKLDRQLKEQGVENENDLDILQRLYGKKEYINNCLIELESEVK